jgi:hypothetical protein
MAIIKTIGIQPIVMMVAGAARFLFAALLT